MTQGPAAVGLQIVIEYSVLTGWKKTVCGLS